MILTEYDEARHIANEKKISYEEGFEKGSEDALRRMPTLYMKMEADGRLDDFLKGAKNREYLHELYEEYGL